MKDHSIISASPASDRGWKNRRRIRINNFRSIVMDDYINIKKVTLLFGKNGTGKSSFIKAIKFLGNNLFPVTTEQSVYKLDDDTDLGDFKEVVFQHDINNNIEIDFEEYWEKFYETNSKKESRIINYRISTVFKNDKNGRNLDFIRIEDLSNYAIPEIFVGNKIFEISPYKKNKYNKTFVHKISDAEVSPEKVIDSLRKIKIGDIGYNSYPNKSIKICRKLNNTKAELNKYLNYLDILPFIDGKHELRYSYFNQLADYLNLNEKQQEDINYSVNLFINSIPGLVNKFFNSWHIPSIREKPLSSYELAKNKFSKKDYYGLLSQIDLLESNFDPDYPFNDYEVSQSILGFLNSNLKLLELAKQVKLQKSNGRGKILVVDQYDVETNLSEASSGLIHILPIVVAAYSSLYNYEDFGVLYEDANSSDLLIIEQPEQHLHPSLQAKLTEFISKSMGTYIIETHSEHIVRKLQVLIAKGKLKREKVAIYYFDKNEKTGITTIKEMELDEKGRFMTDWPPGFFDTDTELALEFFREISKN